VPPREGGASVYAEHGVNTLLVDSGDVREAANAIERLIDDDELIAQIRQRGLETAARFTLASAARQHIELLRACVGRGPVRAERMGP